MWNIVFSRRSIWVLLELVGRSQYNTLPKSTRRHVILDKFIFKTPWLLDLLCKHWFASSVWNFCSWVADVPPLETSLVAKSEEKRMFSQTTPRYLQGFKLFFFSYPAMGWVCFKQNNVYDLFNLDRKWQSGPGPFWSIREFSSNLHLVVPYNYMASTCLQCIVSCMMLGYFTRETSLLYPLSILLTKICL